MGGWVGEEDVPHAKGLLARGWWVWVKRPIRAGPTQPPPTHSSLVRLLRGRPVFVG